LEKANLTMFSWLRSAKGAAHASPLGADFFVLRPREVPCKASGSDFQDFRNANTGPFGCPQADEIFAARSHPDIRIARRAQTIANLARVISEREVSGGLRITLLTQARRLELLANQRLRELGIQAGRTKPEIG
jgi:hypothetical protein